MILPPAPAYAYFNCSATSSGLNVATSALALDVDRPQRKVLDSKANFAGYGVGKSVLVPAPGSAAGGAAPHISHGITPTIFFSDSGNGCGTQRPMGFHLLDVLAVNFSS